MPVRLTFLGSGDAFGSGGRLHTSFLLRSASAALLLDCGPSALAGLRRAGVDPNAVEAIVLSHLHGDHFGGIPFFVLDAQLMSKRTEPLLIAGPPGTAGRLEQAMEVFFPGSSSTERSFEVEFADLEPGRPCAIAGAQVTPYEVRHPSGAPAFALRLDWEGAVLAYSGDTEWTDALLEAARGADVFVAEAYFYEKKVPFHLDYRTLIERAAELGARRIVATHMSADMLSRLDRLDCEHAEDGKTIVVGPAER
jgi:ribonuclease BN (tRNA processing enzyme)